MPSKIDNLALRHESTGSSSSSSKQIVTSTVTAEPIVTSPASPLSPVSALPSPRSPTRSVTFDSLLGRSRSKSPSTPKTLEGLQHSKTVPVTTGQRHKSESSIVGLSKTPSPTEGFFQKRVKEKGSLDHYGRHGNDWLFGGLGIRETARNLISRQNSR